MGGVTAPGTTAKSLPLILARELASNLSTPMFLLDAAGMLVYYNDAAALLLGKTFAELGEIPSNEFAESLHLTTVDGRPAYLVTVMNSGGGAYYVADVNIRYLRPARLGDDLQVISTVEAVRGVSVVIHQRVMRGEEQLTDARVTAAFLDDYGRPQRQPKEWVERFKAIATGV